MTVASLGDIPRHINDFAAGKHTGVVAKSA
jgi:hypothetical protein